MNRRGEERRPDGTIVIRKAVRSARLQVRPDGTVRVVAPRSFDVEGFLTHHAAWIAERRRELASRAAGGGGKDDRLLLRGQFYTLAPGPQFAIDEASRTVACPSVSVLRECLAQMLKEEARSRLAALPDLAGSGPGRIAVKLQKTRWGSCSTLGNINLNLRVMALPGTLREYIVVHEAAHLREQNHSKRFWHLVGDHYPGYRAAEAELRRYWVILERNRVWGSLGETG